MWLGSNVQLRLIFPPWLSNWVTTGEPLLFSGFVSSCVKWNCCAGAVDVLRRKLLDITSLEGISVIDVSAHHDVHPNQPWPT